MSTLKTANDILKAKQYSDIFSNDDAEAKKELKMYCKKYHPDANDSEFASKVFCKLQELYHSRFKKVNGVYGGVKNVVTFKRKSNGKGFELTNPITLSNGIATIYHTSTKICIVYDKTYEKFYYNYIKQVENLKYEDDKMEKEFKRYFPKIVTHFETDDNKYCVLLDKTSEVLNLGHIMRSYQSKGQKFPAKQAAWILNRLYNITCYMNFYNKVSNGISLDNIWVSPEMHTVLLYNGWEYTTHKDADMLGCPKDVYRVLPIKVKDSKKSKLITDLESIKQVGRILYQGYDNLEHINKFLKLGVSDDVFEEWDKYSEALNKDFGKREFIIWDDVPYNTK